MNYTQGEWKLKGAIITAQDDSLIADCRYKSPSSVFEEYLPNVYKKFDELEANAKLIASAPLMYEALKSIKDDGKVKAEFWKLRHKALMKAEGKSV